MSNEVEIEALRPFNRTPQGDICEPGDTFAVTKIRADELERLGLARRADSKSAPLPGNKMALPLTTKRRPARLPEAGAAPRGIIRTIPVPDRLPKP